MTLPFTLQQLRILRAIASEKNFTRAAEILYISQPTLSKQFKLLESHLGILLINRQNNNISLTEAGKVFLQYSERILALCEESCRALNDLKNGDRGSLTIGASQTIGTFLMSRIFALFVQNHPQINLKVQVDSTRTIAKNIINHQIEIGIVSGDVPEELRNNLQIENFVDDNLILILPKCHPFAQKKKKYIKKNELYNLNFITLNSNTTIRKFINNILIQNKIEIKQFNIIMELNSFEAIKTAVSLGLGAAFICSSAIEKEIELKTLEIINIENVEMTSTLLILTNPQSYHSKGFEFFYKDLTKLKKYRK